MPQYIIEEQTAINLTTSWRTNHPGMVKAFKIDKAEINQIFDENPSATGIRAYLGQDTEGPRLVLVGVDSEGNDILTNCYDHTSPCPNNCDESSVLNNGQ